MAALNRARKIQNDIQFSALAIPYLDIDDAINLIDVSDSAINSDVFQWIDSYKETISRGKYVLDYTTTPLAPWPSYEPSPPVDLTQFIGDDDSRPNAIVNIRLEIQIQQIPEKVMTVMNLKEEVMFLEQVGRIQTG